MKHFTTILIVFLLFVTIGEAKQEFMLYHLNYDYNGSCYFNNKIIVFGNSGDFVISDDMGYSWYREHIFVDTVSIVNLIPDGDYLIGARADGMLFKLDKNYKIVKSLIKFPGHTITSLNRYKDSLFSFTTAGYYLYFFNNNFEEYFSVGLKPYNSPPYFKALSGENYDIIAINKDIIHFFKKPYTNILTKISEIGIGKTINDLIKLDNELYVVIDGKLMKVNENTLMPDPAISDSAGGKFIYNNGSIYNVRRNDNWKYSTINFSQLINGKFEQRCILKYDRVITNDFQIKDVKIIDKNTLVAVGTKNTIFISRDGGFQWEPISYFVPNVCKYWLNDKIGFYDNNYDQIFRTTDGGATFLPQKFDTNFVFSFNLTNGSLFYVDEKGSVYRWCGGHYYNFFLSQDSGENYNIKWIDGINGLNEMLMCNPLGFNTIKYHNYSIHNLVNEGYPRSTLLIRINPQTIFETKPDIYAKSTFYKDTNKIFLIQAVNDKIWAYYLKGKRATLSSTDDINLQNWKDEFVFNENFTYDYDFDNIALHGLFHNLTENSFKTPFILSEYDTNFAKEPVYDDHFVLIDSTFKYYKIISHYYIDLNNSIYKLISKDTIDVEGMLVRNINGPQKFIKPGFTKLSYKMPFLVDDGKAYFNKLSDFSNEREAIYCDVNNITDESWSPVWHNIELVTFDKFPNTYSNSNKYVYFHQLTDTKYVSDLLILEKGETINKVPEVEKKESYLYKYLAYPQPGTNEIRVKIYTNNFDCFNSENFEIYNSEGVVYKSKDEFTIQQTGIYEAEIIWDCSKYSPGVYFIKLNCDTNQDAIKVIKN